MSLSDNTVITDKETRLLISELQTQVSTLEDNIGTLTDRVAIIPPTQPLPTPQAVNQIRNGTFSHSVNSWFKDATANDGRYECAWWYSHPIQDGQPMFSNTTRTGGLVTLTLGVVDAGAETITITNHWIDTGLGVRLTGSMPAPLVAGTTYYAIRVDANTLQLAATPEDATTGTPINLTSTTTGGSMVFNYTVKEATHAYYSQDVTDWDWTTGSARPEGLWSLDALIPGNNIEPGYSFYAIFDCVRVNQYITAASGTRIFSGIYHNSTLRGWEFIQAEFVITDTVVGTVSTPTSRDYMIEVITDRGFTVSSSVLTEANAPSDLDFGPPNSARVVLSWKNVLNFGVQTYRIYRKTGATYVLLKEITTGITTYIDNGSFVSVVGGFPSADFTKLVAYTSTIPDVLATVPYAGDPLNPLWATIPFAIRVPQNYNKGDSILTAGQWLRWGLTAPLDINIPDCTATFNSNDIVGTLGLFTDGMLGLSVTITNKFGTQTKIITAVDTGTDTISCNSNWTLGTNAATFCYVHGGGFQGLYVDLAHLSYVAGAAFSPNSEDISPDRGIPPVTPNGTTQGGSGQGGGGTGGDGDPVCLFEQETVLTSTGNVLTKDLEKGMFLPDGYGGRNKIVDIKLGVSDIWYLETERGITLKCTDTKQVYVGKVKKRVVKQLQKGENVLVSIDGEILADPITVKELILKRQIVVQLSLEPNHSFLAGDGMGYMVVSNLKIDNQIFTVF